MHVAMPRPGACRCSAAADAFSQMHQRPNAVAARQARMQLPARCSTRGSTRHRPSPPACAAAARLHQRQHHCGGLQQAGQLRHSGTCSAAAQPYDPRDPQDPPMPADDEEEGLSPEEVDELAAAFKKMWHEGMGADEADDGKERSGLSPQEATQVLQMGSWRLKGLMDPPFEALEAQIEGMWRELLQDNLSLFPMPKELKYVDSLDPEHKTPSSYREADWPERGDDAYPRMQLENRCYASRVFRRLHMELVHRQDSIQVLHCVMFPRLEYDLPILSMDMVGKGGGAISLAVIDPCPVALNRSLPPQYVATVRQLQDKYGMATNRATPEWGKAIFSDLCVILRPTGPEQVSDFLKYAIALTRVHLQLARLVNPVQGANKERRLAEIKEAHARYCAKQLENDKTTRVLEAGFGKEFSERYMRTVVFDEADAQHAKA